MQLFSGLKTRFDLKFLRRSYAKILVNRVGQTSYSSNVLNGRTVLAFYSHSNYLPQEIFRMFTFFILF